MGALTNESATSKAVYFAHCTSEMIYITHLLAENPERLAGPLLADTYVTLLKGRNAWYGGQLASGELNIDVGDSITGKGMIQVCVTCPHAGNTHTSFTVLNDQFEDVGNTILVLEEAHNALKKHECLECTFLKVLSLTFPIQHVFQQLTGC